jgi:hypothetical protein
MVIKQVTRRGTSLVRATSCNFVDRSRPSVKEYLNRIRRFELILFAFLLIESGVLTAAAQPHRARVNSLSHADYFGFDELVNGECSRDRRDDEQDSRDFRSARLVRHGIPHLKTSALTLRSGTLRASSPTVREGVEAFKKRPPSRLGYCPVFQPNHGRPEPTPKHRKPARSHFAQTDDP